MEYEDRYVIEGGVPLRGEMPISGAKNSVLALIAATVLTPEEFVLRNVPDIGDVWVMLEILESLGATVKFDAAENTLYVDSRGVNSDVIDYEISSKCRASYYFLGALMGRFGHAYVAVPGGCNFGGNRPFDYHLKGLRKLGAAVTEEQGSIRAECERLQGCLYCLEQVSVGATINMMLAAVKADGMTIIENAAREPHVVDLANMLMLMGAKVYGAGTDSIRIRGVKELHGFPEYTVIPDQIEAGTYMVAAAATLGNVTLTGVTPRHLESVAIKLRECGFTVNETEDTVQVIANRRGSAVGFRAMPYPGFPTDMQPQMTTLMAMSRGSCIITEGVWTNRFRYVDQLLRMGADIRVEGKAAFVTGVERFYAAPVQADDLRAGAALVIAGLSCEGKTRIGNIYRVERGYEHLIEKVRALGGRIRKEQFPKLD